MKNLLKKFSHIRYEGKFVEHSTILIVAAIIIFVYATTQSAVVQTEEKYLIQLADILFFIAILMIVFVTIAKIKRSIYEKRHIKPAKKIMFLESQLLRETVDGFLSLGSSFPRGSGTFHEVQLLESLRHQRTEILSFPVENDISLQVSICLSVKKKGDYIPEEVMRLLVKRDRDFDGWLRDISHNFLQSFVNEKFLISANNYIKGDLSESEFKTILLLDIMKNLPAKDEFSNLDYQYSMPGDLKVCSRDGNHCGNLYVTTH